MIIILFFILCGILTNLFLVSPNSYYPLLIVIALVSTLMFVFSKKYFTINLKTILISIMAFLLSFSLSSFLIFKPSNYNYPNFKNIDNLKKAVIFYCEGEMEKYTPFYSNYFLKDKNIFLKPIYCFKIKRFYNQIKVNEKNKDLTQVAQQLKKSILNYKPYYFYIAFEGYTPNIKQAITSAIEDGCKSIYIINYTTKEIETKINNEVDLDFLRDKGISIKISRPVYESDIFINYFVNKINNLPERYKGILIYDNKTQTSEKLKERLVKHGFSESGIIISKDLKSSFDYFKSQQINNILFVNLSSSGNGVEAENIIRNELLKYSPYFKIHAIKSWGYDIELVKACISQFKKIEN
ncbi:hypothetical protein SAMN05660865_00851 [Caloramator fervidus]|uniref:Uncharacterized protein n=1 Tax=Caloramator fervidus TaxID=29344 RepID=A0A1H5UCP8_9CLOT|nr:hypothetical protein [Caloramator fervidus]SEF72037.1 hypothetical protein SAMN05660865_00851 [Caloramator fervidus]